MAAAISTKTTKLGASFLRSSTIIAICLFFALLCACIVIGHLLEEYRWANESITALLLLSEIGNLFPGSGGWSGQRAYLQDSGHSMVGRANGGAVTIALSYNQLASSSSSEPADDCLMITSTIIVVLFSTMVFGSIIEPLIEAVIKKKTYMSSFSDGTDIPSLEELRIPYLELGEADQTQPEAKVCVMQFTTRTVRYFWRKFENRFMRPYFGGRGFVPFVPSSPIGATEPSTSTHL